MTRFQTICATICFVMFFGVLVAPRFTQQHYEHELALAKIKAGCTKE